MKRRTFSTEPKITGYGDGIYNILMPVAFNTYLVLGDEKALLIDTGMGIGSLKAIVQSLTSLPVQVLNTHGHPDHAGGNAEFGPALIYPDDKATADRMANLDFRKNDISEILNGEHQEMIAALQPDSDQGYMYLQDGDVIDLGGRRLTVYHTPGHTAGSVCVYDEASGALFGGDTVQPNISITSTEYPFPDAMLTGLLKMAPRHITRIMYGHNMPAAVQDGRALLDNVILLLKGIKAQTAPYADMNQEGGIIRRYSLNGINLSLRIDAQTEGGSIQSD